GMFSPYIMGNWQDVGRYTRQNPDAKVDFGLDFRWRRGGDRLTATLSGQYIHGLFMQNYNRDPIADVFYLDFTIRYAYRTKKYTLEPYLNVRNILDTRYAFVEDYTMPGFNFLAGVRIRL
ncbi:TonB-dependent receptor, partial [Myxococcota bacterium]|nr:TonB-dependent receptor [Myxococcota bacterium]